MGGVKWIKSGGLCSLVQGVPRRRLLSSSALPAGVAMSKADNVPTVFKMVPDGDGHEAQWAVRGKAVKRCQQPLLLGTTRAKGILEPRVTRERVLWECMSCNQWTRENGKTPKGSTAALFRRRCMHACRIPVGDAPVFVVNAHCESSSVCVFYWSPSLNADCPASLRQA